MTSNEVGVVGLGRQGTALAVRLTALGMRVHGYDRDRFAVAAAVALGVVPVTLPADAAEDVDVVFVAMPDEPSAEEVLFDHGGVGETLRSGGYVIDASSVGGLYSRTATARFAAYGISRVEVHLETTAGGVRAVVGCSATEFERVRQLLRAVADEIAHAGPIGSVSHGTPVGVAAAAAFTR